MSEFLDKLKESRRAAKMRMGQNAPDFVALKSDPELRLAMVPLTEMEYQNALEQAASVEIAENAYGTELRDRVLQVHTLLYALRQPDDPNKRAFETIDQMLDSEVGLQPVDVNYLMDYYQRMIDFSSPAMDGLTDEALADLKKAFVTTDWSVLSGKPWWHLKQFFMTLPAGLPLDNSPSLSSILNLIGTSENPESTPGASSS